MEISSAFRWTYKCGMVWDLISRIVIIWDFCSTDINNTLYYSMTGDEIYFQNTGSCCFWNWRNIFRFQLHTYVGTWDSFYKWKTEKFFLRHRIQMSLYIQIQRRGTCSFRHQINIQVLMSHKKYFWAYNCYFSSPDTKGHERYCHNFASFCLSSVCCT